LISRFKDLPHEWRVRLLDQAREARRASDVFTRVCREGDGEHLYNAHLLLNECDHTAWRLAMAKAAKLPPVSPDIQDAFLSIWIENKMLPLRVGHRPTMAAALRVLMPRNYSGPPLVLYRGTHIGERRRHLYGFSWTTDIATARGFAEHWSQPGIAFQGVVLRTLAPPEAVLLVRRPEDHFDESEVVVDPFRLGKVDVLSVR
jgi:hypothetical protein